MEGRQSSPDLQTQILMDMRAESRDGFKTLHEKFDRLDNKIEAHARDDVHVATSLRGEIADVRAEHAQTRERLKAVETNDERDAEARSVFGPSVNGTGRYNIPPPGAPPPVQINVGTGNQDRKSVPPWVSTVWPYVKHYGIPALIAAATIAWHFLTGTEHLKIVQLPASPPAYSGQAPAPSAP